MAVIIRLSNRLATGCRIDINLKRESNMTTKMKISKLKGMQKSSQTVLGKSYPMRGLRSSACFFFVLVSQWLKKLRNCFT